MTTPSLSPAATDTREINPYDVTFSPHMSVTLAAESAGSPAKAAASPNAIAHSSEAQSVLKLVLPLGRGGLGKSFWVRWLIDRTNARSGQLVIADANRIYQSLSPYFDGVLTMSGDHEHHFTTFLDTIARRQIADRLTAVDFGPSLGQFRPVLKHISLVNVFKRGRIDIVAVYFLSSDPGDIPYLKAFDDLLAPTASVIVFSEAGDIPRPSAAAFQRAIEHPIVREIRKRGAEIVRFSHLDCAPEVNATHRPFTAAQTGAAKDGHKPLGLFDQERVGIWLENMERNFAPVIPLLT